MTSVEEVTRTYFRGNDDTELCPKDGFAASSAFDPGTDVSLRLRPALRQPCRSYIPRLIHYPDEMKYADALRSWGSRLGRLLERTPTNHNPRGRKRASDIDFRAEAYSAAAIPSA